MASTVTLVSRVPADSPQKVDVKSNIVLTFSAAVKAGTGTIRIVDEYGTVYFSDTVTSSAVTIAGKTVTINPVKDLPFAARLNVWFSDGWLLDSSDQSITMPYYFSFSTSLSPTAVTLVGTDLADRLHGSDLADHIEGGGGSDQLWGYGGDDILIGGNESSGTGYGDYLYGGDGNDTLQGGNGSDTLYGGAGNDILKGEADNDDLRGEAGDDLLEGGAGDDFLTDEMGSNTLLGGDGKDSIRTGGGLNTIDGGAGNDNISALGSDKVLGGDGDDRIRIQMVSQGRNGSADGGAGKDSFDLILNKTTDTAVSLSGGADSDSYVLTVSTYGEGSYQAEITDFLAGAGGDTIDLANVILQFGAGKGNPFAAGAYLRLQADGADTLLVLKNNGDWTLLRFKNVAPAQFTKENFIGGYSPDGSSSGLTIEGTAGNDYLNGFELDDKLYGGAGSDQLSGGGGNDVLEGGPESGDGGDTLNGGSGDDILRGGAGNDYLYGDAGNDLLEGGSGDDNLNDSTGDNTLRGGVGNDSISVSGGTYVADGGEGNDYITVSGGSGSVNGGAGKDTLTLRASFPEGPRAIAANGGDDDDTLVVDSSGYGEVAYTLTGGGGADTFVFKPQFSGGKSTQVITDFSVADGDSLDLTALLPSGLLSNPFGAAGYLKLEQVGADTVVWFDRNGAADLSSGFVKVVTLQGVLASQLTGANFVNGYAPDGSTTGISLTGTAGNDTLTGTALDDTISGLAGRDLLTGGNGNDILRGGDEADNQAGDELYGQEGNDSLYGGAGRDTLYGGNGDDQLFGGSGDDTLYGGAGNDKLDGGEGNDYLSDDGGDSTLMGGGGDDRLDASRGSHKLYGGAGNDTLNIGAGVIAANGDAGDDKFIIAAQSGDVTTNKVTAAGGEGNDHFTFGTSNYTSAAATIAATGGAGRDTYAFTAASLSKITITDFATGAGGDLLEVMTMFSYGFKQNPFGSGGYLRIKQDGADTLLQFDQDGAAGSAYTWRDIATFSNTSVSAFTRDNFVYGLSPAGDSTGPTLTGGAGADSLQGNFLDDTLNGMGGNDTLIGGEGNDTLDGGEGNDTLRGGEGNDTLEGGAGTDNLEGATGNDKLSGGDGNDVLSDNAGDNVLEGGAGDDTISSVTLGRTTVQGGDGNDTIGIGAGHHTIDAGSGDDIISFSYLDGGFGEVKVYVSTANGGDGNDQFRLSSLRGVEARLTGGAGTDTYALSYAPQENKYVVTDFVAGAGGDRIDFVSLLGGGSSNFKNPFAAGGTMRLVQEGADTVLYWDSDGAGPKQFQAVLKLENVQAASVTGHNFVGGYQPDGSLRPAPVSGTDAADTMSGTGMNDIINGAGGADVIYGNDGDDVLNGDAGADRLEGGYGDDVLNGGLDNDSLIDASGNNTLRGDDGDDTLDSSSPGRNLLEGGSGKDTLRGGSGTDTLDGGDGNDNLSLADRYYNSSAAIGRTVKGLGGDGDDVITLGSITDKTASVELWGGAGADRFMLSGAGLLKDTSIMDFDAASGDKVSISSVNGQFSVPSYNPFATGAFRLQQNGADTQVMRTVEGSEKVWFILKNIVASSVTYQSFVEGFDPRAAAAMNVSGSAKADRIVAGDKADTISGEDGNDNLYGLAGDDILRGGEGNDRLWGGVGNDRVEGGAGIDTAYMQTLAAGTKILIENGTAKVQDVTGTYGTDTLVGVERLFLSDKCIALDVGADGTAGKLYRVYQAAFDRKPDGGGIGFWIGQADAGTSMNDIANGFVASEEFRKLYGATPGNRELVARLYQNVLHREGEKDGVDFWVGVLDKKSASVAEVLVAFAESAENVQAIAKVIGTGFEYTPWLG
ncbi:type I secretion C-terminal target domain-containing protein [Pseudoduganella sp. OTU4001]|uniref:type I secretion C-terminal target domain-containing protein n=1 Tax=Pseudoduganella sp. OTU4001 TaxID=3043854 RepID=UPI00313ECD76